MNETLSRFLEALRHADLRISTAEILDAYQTVDVVGISDRARLKDALALSVAKSAEEQERFDETFDQFFAHIDIEALSQGADGDASDNPEGGGAQDEASSALEQFAMDGNELSLLGAMGQAARQVGLDRMWLFTQKNLFTRRIMDEMGLTEMEREMRGMEEGSGDLERMQGARERAERDIDGRLANPVDHRLRRRSSYLGILVIGLHASPRVLADSRWVGLGKRGRARLAALSAGGLHYLGDDVDRLVILVRRARHLRGHRRDDHCRDALPG